MYTTCLIRRHSVYCLVDEVLRGEKIMPDEKKKKAIQGFFLRHAKKKNKKKTILLFKKWINHREFVYFHDYNLTLENHFYFFLRCEPDRMFHLLFFFLRRGQKDPGRISSTKQYTECRLKDTC